MILDFPHKSVLQLVLQGGIVPLEIMAHPMRFSYGEDGHVFLEFDQELSQKALEKLNLLGIYRSSRHPTEQVFSAHCWYQAIPLEKDTDPTRQGRERSGNVIFEINNEENLRVVVEEILRLGNDRMALLCYRQINSNEFVALLHVNSPPYYTVLKALEPDIGSRRKTIWAYYEQTPRCWVELGWKYPLAHLITVPESRRLFIRAPHQWEFFDDAPFQNIYQSLDIQIPAVHCLWQAQDQVSKIPIPLRLIPGDPYRVEPSLWLIPEQRQLDFEEWLRGANENILNRLSFAVAEAPGQEQEKWIILYAETYGGTAPPPILDLDMADPYVTHPLVRNIYLPRGYALHPSLRAETLQRLLVTDADQIVWLRPLDKHAFQPFALSLSAFRRLSEWIDYLIAQHQAVLKEWVDATVFDWPSDMQQVVSRPKPDDGESPPSAPTSSHDTSADKALSSDQHPKIPEANPSSSSSREGGKTPRASKTKRQQPSSVASPHHTLLRELEQRFLQVPGNRLDDPERVRMWPELAQAYGQVQQLDQSALCWLHALWHCEPADILPLLEEWFMTEWEGQDIPNVKQWKRMLDNRLYTRSVVQRLVVSLMYWTLRYPENCTTEFLQAFQGFLDNNREQMPLRAQWLAYYLLSQKQRDSLLLSRCADRLLEQLLNDPSVALYDLPRFLHKGSLQYQRVYRKFKDRLNDLLNGMIQWVNLSCSGNGDRYSPYVYYLFAYMAARLGMPSECELWTKKAEEKLKQVFSGDNFSNDAVSEIFNLYVTIIDRSYKHRINEVMNKIPHSSKLPQDIYEIISELKSKCEQLSQENELIIPRMAYYVVKRLLQKSEVLEPIIQKSAFSTGLEEASSKVDLTGYMQSLRHVLAQISSAGCLNLKSLWGDFIEQLQKLFDKFPLDDSVFGRQEIGGLARIYTHAFQIAGLYGQQGWIDDLLGILYSHSNTLEKYSTYEIPCNILLISELVPIALFLQRVCQNSYVLKFVRQELQPWGHSYAEKRKNHRFNEEVICVHISAAIAEIAEDPQQNKNELERLHQDILDLRPSEIEKSRYVRTVLNYIRCICYMNDEIAIDYIYNYFNDCVRNKIYIPFSYSSNEYLSLDYIQVTESLVYALDAMLGGGLSSLCNRSDLRNDWQIESEYLLRCRIINDIKVSSSGVIQ